MPHAFAISIPRPYNALCVSKLSDHRVPSSVMAWNLLIAALTIACGLLYVFSVNTASAHGYKLRKMETRVESLKTETTLLQNKVVMLSSIHELSARATALGFVPAGQLEFVHPASKSYAMR